MNHLLLQLAALAAVTLWGCLLVRQIDRALRKRMASSFRRECAVGGLIALYLLIVLGIFA